MVSSDSAEQSLLFDFAAHKISRYRFIRGEMIVVMHSDGNLKIGKIESAGRQGFLVQVWLIVSVCVRSSISLF